MRAIETPKQLKSFMTDICNRLKSKKIINQFTFVKSLNEFIRLKIDFSVKTKDYYFYVNFWRADVKSDKRLIHSKFLFLNQSEFYFTKVNDRIFEAEFISHVTKKRKGLVREIEFEEVLKILQEDGYISEYRKSTDNEDKAGVDWYVYKNEHEEIGIDVKSSIYGIKRLDDKNQNEDVIFQIYDQSKTDKEISKELISQINQLLKSPQVM